MFVGVMRLIILCLSSDINHYGRTDPEIIVFTYVYLSITYKSCQAYTINHKRFIT